jgi:hypothetical protein
VAFAALVVSSGLSAQEAAEVLRLDYTIVIQPATPAQSATISKKTVFVAPNGRIRTEDLDPSTGEVRSVQIDDPLGRTVIVLDPANKMAYHHTGIRRQVLPGSELIPQLARKQPAGAAAVAGIACQKFIGTPAVKALPVELIECRDSASGRPFVANLRTLGFTGGALAGSTQTLEQVARVPAPANLFTIPSGYRTMEK